jgi:hypothetical protein
MHRESKNNHIIKLYGKSKGQKHRTCTPSSKNIEKSQAEVRLIAKECRVTDERQTLIENLNRHVFAHANQPFSLMLIMDESKHAGIDVRLTAEEIKFLRQYADPPAVDFVEEAMTEVSIANRELTSFKLRLRLEAATLHESEDGARGV